MPPAPDSPDLHIPPFGTTNRPLLGTWRHNNGYLCCGTLRIARADFDTDPDEKFRIILFDWMVARLNAPDLPRDQGELCDALTALKESASTLIAQSQAARTEAAAARLAASSVARRTFPAPGMVTSGTHEPPAYRLLETGEIIQEGDEFLGDASQLWLPAFGIRIEVEPGRQYRRPITGGAGLHEAATVSQEPRKPRHREPLAIRCEECQPEFACWNGGNCVRPRPVIDQEGAQ
jgi:hypothetical protein